MVRFSVRGRRKGTTLGKAPKDIIRTTLWAKYTSSSSSGTALSSVTALKPADATGWTSAFNNVFDEAKCLGVAVMWDIEGLSVAGPLYGHAGVAFEPSANAATYGSVAAVLGAKYMSGPVAYSSSTTGPGLGNTPQPVTKNGMWSFKAKTLADNISANDVQAFVGGGWFTTASTSAIIGYLKPYAEAMAGVTQSITYFVGYDMEFAYRT